MAGTMIKKTIEPVDADYAKRWKLVSLLSEFQNISEMDSVRLGVGSEIFDKYDLAWVVTQMELRITKIASLFDEVSLITRPGGSRKYFCKRHYSCLDANGEMCIEGTSNWVVLNRESGRMVLPDNLSLAAPVKGLEMAEAAPAPFEMSRIRIGESQGMTVREYTSVYSDMDMNKHVNNTKYVEWIMNILPFELVSAKYPVYLNIAYRKEVKLGDRVLIEYIESSDSEFSVRGRRKESDEVFFECVLKF